MAHISLPVGVVPPRHTRGFISALGIGQICSWGSLYYSFPLIAEAMSAELGWSKPSLYGAATLGLLATALASYPAGVAIDRGHGRWVMGLGSFLAGMLLLLWSQLSSLGLFYFVVISIGALQAATLYESAFAVIARRMGPTHARSGITSLTLWGGFATTVFIPLVQWLLNQWGWREALIALAAINAIICAGAYLLFIRPEHDVIADKKLDKVAQNKLNSQALRHTLRRPVFWAVLAAMTAYAVVFSAFTFHMYPLFLERGLTTTAVVQTIALIGPSQVLARIALSIFASSVPIRIIGSVVTLIFPLLFATLVILRLDFYTAALICIGFGVINGTFTIVRGTVVPEMISRRAYGTINGVIAIPVCLAKAAAPLGAAALWSINESYQSALVAIFFSACILAGSFALAAMLSRTKTNRKPLKLS